MGMQVFFDVVDLEHANIKHHMEEEDGIASLYCSDGPQIRVFYLTGGRQVAWFDVVSASSGQLGDVRWLIRNRIPFTCS